MPFDDLPGVRGSRRRAIRSLFALFVRVAIAVAVASTVAGATHETAAKARRGAETGRGGGHDV